VSNVSSRESKGEDIPHNFREAVVLAQVYHRYPLRKIYPDVLSLTSTAARGQRLNTGLDTK
jgi:hypothetical protein